MVKKALIKDGWQITHDPYEIKTPDFKWEADLGAEKLFAAQKKNKKIVVEVKSFLEESTPNAFHKALGQYINYRIGIKNQELGRLIYLAVPIDIFETFFHYHVIQQVVKINRMKTVAFDPIKIEIVSWND